MHICAASLFDFCPSLTAHILTAQWFMNYTRGPFIIRSLAGAGASLWWEYSVLNTEIQNRRQKASLPILHVPHHGADVLWSVHSLYSDCDPVGRDQTSSVVQWISQSHVRSPYLGHWARLAAMIYEALWNLWKVVTYKIKGMLHRAFSSPKCHYYFGGKVGEM